MGKLKNYLIVVLLIIFTFIGCGSKVEDNKLLTEEEKIEDFEYLYKVIEENYPFLEVNKRVSNIDWLEKKEDYLRLVKQTKSDRTYLATLNSILGGLNNGHTHMIMNSKEFEWMRDGYSKVGGWQNKFQLRALDNKKALSRYNIEEDKEEASKENYREEILAVNNASVKDVVEGKVGYIYVPQMIAFYTMENDIKLLDEYLDKIKGYDSLIIDIRNNGGGDTGYWSSYLIPKIADKNYSSTTYTFWKDGDVINQYLKDSKGINKLFLDKVEDLDLESLPNIPEEIENDFKYYQEFEWIIEPKEDSINFKGNIYLLVNRGVYSSAEAFANFAKNSGFATLVGERTAGDGIGTDPLLVMLPNSGYIFRMSKDMGLTSDGTCNEEFKTEPHYIVENSNKNLNLTEDFDIQKVLELEGINIE